MSGSMGCGGGVEGSNAWKKGSLFFQGLENFATNSSDVWKMWVNTFQTLENRSFKYTDER